MKVIETKRLILRPWVNSDADSLYEYAQNPNVAKDTGWPAHKSKAESLEIIKEVLSEDETYAITIKGSDNAVGSIGLMFSGKSNITVDKDEAELGYWIGEPFWGQGYITEAVFAILSHAFEDLKLSTVWCGYFDGNIRSKRVQEKCGFFFHHTEENVHWEITNEEKTLHISFLHKDQRKKNQ